MEIAFIGAGACFANVLQDILAKCTQLKDKDLKWRILHRALIREGSGPRFKGHYVDCGPELGKAKQEENLYTYDISKGGILSGSGNVATGEKFFRDAEWSVGRDLETNLSKSPPSLILSIRGAGATNCGAGFLLDQKLLKTFENSLLLQFVILPYRGEGIEASRVIYLTHQVMKLLTEYPDRYAPVLISNEQIMAGAKSFQQAGMNWFYPLANTIVADVIVRLLYPTLYHVYGQGDKQVGEGAFEIDSRQKYLDMRDFTRQPGFRSVSFSYRDAAEPLTEPAMEELVDGALGTLQVTKRPNTDAFGISGNLAPMENALTAFALLTGPRGAVGDMTKMALSDILEDRIPGSFPRGYTYDITPGQFELLLFSGGGVPTDLQKWCKKFLRNQRNPRYRELVEQSTYPFEKMLKFFEKVIAHFHITPA